jgi:hypothetical protein
MMSIENVSIHREVVSRDHCSADMAIRELLTDRGHSIVGTGCPIDGHIAMLHDNEWRLWRCDQPELLTNALGAKDGLVDPTVALATTVEALNAERTHLVIAVPNFEGPGSVHESPTNVEVISIKIAGELVDFVDDRPAGRHQWAQLHEFLAVQVALAVERDERLYVSPIQYEEGEYPSVRAWAEPGEYIDDGDGFYVETLPYSGEDCHCDAPIAPYRRSSLTQVSDAMCDVIKSWDVSPLNLIMYCTGRRKGTYWIPE